MPTAANQPVGEELDVEVEVTCDSCDSTIREDDHRWMNDDGDTWCRDCTDVAVDDATFYCDTCGYDHLDRSEWDSGDLIPSWRWAEGSYFRLRLVDRESNDIANWCTSNPPACNGCGEALRDDIDINLDHWHPDEPSYCRECENEYGVVNDWDFVPYPYHFYSMWGEGEGRGVLDRTDPLNQTPYLGIELEMERARPHAEAILDLFGDHPNTVYLKTDGSLDEDGLELVSHPGTFEWWMEAFNWDALGQISKLRSVHYGPPVAYGARTTGIHVHISADAFTHSHLFKFLAFHYRNPTICQVVGQRTDQTTNPATNVGGHPTIDLPVLNITGHCDRVFLDAELKVEMGLNPPLVISDDGASRMVLKWRAMGTIAGFDTVYRLERISGRYADVPAEKSAPRTIYALAQDEGFDVWPAVRRYHDWLPFADALYGSAAYVPLAESADYVVTVSGSGLVVRPANDAARKAVGRWH